MEVPAQFTHKIHRLWGRLERTLADGTNGTRCVGFERALKAILVVDAVEFGRLTEADEAGAVAHWFGIVDAVKSTILPAHGGRLVKELGDGLLIAFDEARPAAAAALAI